MRSQHRRRLHSKPEAEDDPLPLFAPFFDLGLWERRRFFAVGFLVACATMKTFEDQRPMTRCGNMRNLNIKSIICHQVAAETRFRGHHATSKRGVAGWVGLYHHHRRPHSQRTEAAALNFSSAFGARSSTLLVRSCDEIQLQALRGAAVAAARDETAIWSSSQRRRRSCTTWRPTSSGP